MQIFVMKILTVLVVVVLDVNVVSYKITVATGSNLHLVIPVYMYICFVVSKCFYYIRNRLECIMG